MNELVSKKIDDFVNNYSINNHVAAIWQTSLVGVASANDEIFKQLKKVVSPTHAGPKDLLPTAQSVLVYFLPFIKEIPKSNRGGEMASVEWASAYVETNEMIMALNNFLNDLLQEQGYDSKVLPPTHNFDAESLISDWSHKHVAYIAGLGDFGYHHQLITQKGSCGRLGSLITEAPLKPTLRSSATFCSNRFDESCRVCQQRCPMDALQEEEFDRHGCYDLLLKNEALHSAIGRADVCGKCVAVVPCSFLNPVRKKAQRLVRTQLLIEKASETDLADILNLQKLAYQTEADRYNDPDIPPMKQTIEEIRKEFADQHFLKASINDRIIGSVRLACKDGTGFIGKLIVHPDFQKLGVGRRLMTEIEILSTEMQRFELFTGHESTGPLSLYASMGYLECDRKPLESHTLVFLEKLIDNK